MWTVLPTYLSVAMSPRSGVFGIFSAGVARPTCSQVSLVIGSSSLLPMKKPGCSRSGTVLAGCGLSTQGACLRNDQGDDMFTAGLWGRKRYIHCSGYRALLPRLVSVPFAFGEIQHQDASGRLKLHLGEEGKQPIRSLSRIDTWLAWRVSSPLDQRATANEMGLGG